MDKIKQTTKQFPVKLKTLMKEYGEDALGIANIMGVSERTVRRMLSGETLPTYRELLALYFEFGEPIGWLLGIEEKR